MILPPFDPHFWGRLCTVKVRIESQRNTKWEELNPYVHSMYSNIGLSKLNKFHSMLNLRLIIDNVTNAYVLAINLEIAEMLLSFQNSMVIMNQKHVLHLVKCLVAELFVVEPT
ncbi:hypothetical protein DERF_013227 [Dermatophagoides farinae]|uniref:Uncharacterized protein n=1 Tax=Dermatophagoides farinae TaxID=6954 RepID=A0A922HP88_DERFA|nr:hypothetical protein DERF_013227 [Dermatophagoides farinae]